MKHILILIAFLTTFALNSNAQENTVAESSTTEKFGNTLNIGVGVGYYGYIGRTTPVVSLNYEFDVVKNFTLAPFLGLYSYQSNYYWGDPNKPYRQYSYRETAVPIGVKGTYYFDQLFDADSEWDFYAAGSLGFVYRSIVWEDGYYGDRYAYRKSNSPLYLDIHIGAEYHINNKMGIFLDLSTGVSTAGLAVHF